MKKIIIPLNNDHTFPEDVKRIVQILADRDIECGEMEANYLWAEYSDSLAAGWMALPENDDDVYGCISLGVLKYAKKLV